VDAIVELTKDAIDVPTLTAHLHDAAAGGVCIFVGVTRAERRDGMNLVALDYHAYEDMATQQLRDLASRAKARWPVERLVLVHRLGRVQLAEASVFVGVAMPHRAEAFEACRWLIDTLKAELAVWKKDVWGDGSENWTKANAEALQGKCRDGV